MSAIKQRHKMQEMKGLTRQ